MPWPLSQDYNEAIQSPQTSFGDPELRGGQVAVNAMGLPLPCSGNFADVYRVTCASTGRTWAVKCFTRQIPGLRERYQQISLYLKQLKLPFMVDFTFLDQGMRMRGDWYPILKMEWAEGQPLNQFVKNHLDKPQVLEKLCQMWIRLASRLREANLAHCDLQHGNVLLVPGSKTGLLGLKLVDYDGMCVPSLTMLKSLEVGHPAYQHSQRLREGIYNLEVDRFSHLVIYTALRSLLVGGRSLWERYDNGDNMLFSQADFKTPAKSPLFKELQASPEAEVRRLAQVVYEAAQQPIERAPLLADLVLDERVAAAPGAKPSPARPAVFGVSPAPQALPTALALPDDSPSESPRPRRRKAQAPQPRRVNFVLVASIAALMLVLGGLAVFGIGLWLNAKMQPQVVKTDAATNPAKTNVVDTDIPAGQPPGAKDDAKAVSAQADMQQKKETPKLTDGPESKLPPFPEAKAPPPKTVLDPPPEVENKTNGNNSPVAVRSFVGHVGPVNDVALHPDRRHFASCGADGHVRFWDLTTEQQVWKVDAHVGELTALCIAPDGQKVFTAGQGKFLFVDKDNLKPQIVGEFKGNLCCPMQMGDDGGFLLFATSEKDFHRVNILGKKGSRTRIDVESNEHAHVVAFSPDARLLLCTREDKTSRLYQVGVSNSLGIIDGTMVLETGAFAPNGRRVAACGRDSNAIVLWELPTYKKIAQSAPKQDVAPIHTLAYSADSRRLVAGHNDGTIRVYDAASLKELASVHHAAGPINRALFLSDGQGVLFAAADGTIALWTLPSAAVAKAVPPKSPPDPTPVVEDNTPKVDLLKPIENATSKPPNGTVIQFIGHSGPVNDLALHPDGHHFASCGADKTLRFWSLDPNKLVWTMNLTESVPTAVCFSSDGNMVWTALSEKLYRVELATKEQIWFGNFSEKVHFPIQLTPDDKYALFAASNNTIYKGQIKEKKVTPHRIHAEAKEEATVLAFSPDGQWWLTSGADKTVRIYRDTGMAIQGRVINRNMSATIAAFSPDGQRVVAVDGRTNAIGLWETSTGKQLANLTMNQKNAPTTAIAFSPDGSRLVLGREDGWISFRSGVNLLTEPIGSFTRTGRLNRVLFLPDGKRVLFASNDRAVGVLTPPDPMPVVEDKPPPIDLPKPIAKAKTPAKATRLFLGHVGPVNDIALHPDGLYFASGGDDKTVRYWDLQTGKQLWSTLFNQNPVNAVWCARGGNDVWGGSTGKISNTVMDQKTTGGLIGIQGTVLYPMQQTPDDKYILYCCSTKAYSKELIATGETRKTLMHPDSALDAYVLAWSADSKLVLTTGEDKSVRLSAVGVPNTIAFLDKDLVAEAGAFSPNGQKVVACGRQSNVMCIWETSTAKLLRKSIPGKDAAPIHTLCFSPDGRRLLSGHEDGSVRLWDTATLKEISTIQCFPARINRAIFLHNGQSVLCAGANGSIGLWTLPK